MIIQYSKYLLIWCALIVGGPTEDKTCLENKINYYDTQLEMLYVFNNLTSQQKSTAILFGGDRLDVLSQYEVKLSTK